MDKPIQFDFATVLHDLKYGRAFTRAAWPGHSILIALQPHDIWSPITVPYIFMRTKEGDRVPWTPSQVDLLATDWEIV